LRGRTIAIGVVTAIIALVLAALIPGTYATVSAENYNNFGVQEYEKGNYEKAIEYFTKAIELKPDYAEAYFNRGLAYFKMGSRYTTEGRENLNSAIVDFSKAIELNPNFIDAYYSRGLAKIAFIHFYDKPFSQETEQLFESAIEDFKKSLSLDPEYYIAYAGLGNAYDLHGDFGKAIEAYEEALKHKDEILKKWGKDALANIYYSAGRANQRIDRLNTVRVLYEKALELNPNHEMTLGHLVSVYVELKELEKALNIANKCVSLKEAKKRLGTWDFHSWHSRGIVYYKLGMYEKALKDLNKALELAEKWSFIPAVNRYIPQMYREVGSIYLKMGDEAKAKEYFEKTIEATTKIIEQTPKFAYKAYLDRGLAYAELGEYEKAMNDLIKSAELAPKMPIGHDYYFVKGYQEAGIIYMKLGNYERAREYFEKALKAIEEYEYDLPHIRGEIEELLSQLPV